MDGTHPPYSDEEDDAMGPREPSGERLRRQLRERQNAERREIAYRAARRTWEIIQSSLRSR